MAARKRRQDYASEEAPRHQAVMVPLDVEPLEIAGAQSLALERAARADQSDRYDTGDVEREAERIYGHMDLGACWTTAMQWARERLRS